MWLLVCSKKIERGFQYKDQQRCKMGTNNDGMIGKKVLLILAFAFTSCFNQNSTYTNKKVILKKRPLVCGKFINYPSGELKFLIDTMNGKEFGYLFEFSQTGYLRNLSFKINTDTSTYREKFDLSKNALEETSGTPIVYETIDADMHPDSMYFEYLISDFSFRVLNFEISDSGREYKTIKVADYPKLKFIKVASFVKNTRDKDRIYVIAKLTGKYSNDSTIKVFYDTADYSRNKKILLRH